jgi:PleD family two-component response regulator
MNAASPPASALEAKALLHQALQDAWIRGAAESTPLSLLIVSFDKPETPAGVEILQRALQVHCARTRDVVLRRSHDQFAAVLPDTPPAGGHRVGEQIVEAMRAADTDHAHRVSVGVAVVVPDNHREPVDLLRRAETALQAARNNGGDRCLGGSTTTSPAAPAPQGLLAQLHNLLPQKPPDPTRRRHVD